MLRPVRTALLALSLPLALGAAARAATPLELHPTPEVELPFGDVPGFPPGPGSDVIAANCTACHSADHTLNQPSLSRAEWHTVVDKMITAYKAPITPEDATAIVDYLARVKGEP
jgi:cytochrome c5